MLRAGDTSLAKWAQAHNPSSGAPVGWDTVISVALARVGISVVNSDPTEIAYLSVDAVDVRIGVTCWERTLQVRGCIVVASTRWRVHWRPLLRSSLWTVYNWTT